MWACRNWGLRRIPGRCPARAAQQLARTIPQFLEAATSGLTPLGTSSSFTIDVQPKVIQPRAHIAEFFVGDDWKVSPRLTLNIATRYTLNFPSTEVHDQGAFFNLQTQVLDFPHTARDLEFGDFGPRIGAAYRLSNSLVVRAGCGI